MAKRIHKYFLPFIFLLCFISIMPVLVIRPVTYYSPGAFLSPILSTSFATAGFLALMTFLIGVVMVIISHGKSIKINKGKHLISFSIFSLVVIFFIYSRPQDFRIRVRI